MKYSPQNTLRVCTAPDFPNKELTNHIVKALLQDANFAIKQRAKSLEEGSPVTITDKTVEGRSTERSIDIGFYKTAGMVFPLFCLL